MLALAAVWLGIPVREQDKGVHYGGRESRKSGEFACFKGKCGRCNAGKDYVRAKGAVYSWAELKDLSAEYWQGRVGTTNYTEFD